MVRPLQIGVRNRSYSSISPDPGSRSDVPRYLGILGSWDLGILGSWDLGISGSREILDLEIWRSGHWGSRDLGRSGDRRSDIGTPSDRVCDIGYPMMTHPSIWCYSVTATGRVALHFPLPCCCVTVVSSLTPRKRVLSSRSPPYLGYSLASC